MSEYASGTIDLGMVVTNIDKSVTFYRDAVGFEVVGGFEISPQLGGDGGLSNNKGFKATVLSLSGDKSGTKLKLIEFADAGAVKNDFIESSTGVRYLTVRVTDMNKTIARARKAGAEPLASGPAELPAELSAGTWLAVIRDPDGHMVEFVGPKGS